MAGPFTTITVDQWHAFQDLLMEAECAQADLHQALCTEKDWESCARLSVAIDRVKKLMPK